MSDLIFWCFFIAPVSFFYLLYWSLVHFKTASDQVAYKETASYRQTLIRIKASAIVFIISAAVLYCNIEIPKSPPSTSTQDEKNAPTESTAKVMAKTLCEIRIKDSLKAPSTADFPLLNQASFDGNRRATLVSYVDAQNSFGAQIRTHFVCTVEYGGGDVDAPENWKIVDLVIAQ